MTDKSTLHIIEPSSTFSVQPLNRNSNWYIIVDSLWSRGIAVLVISVMRFETRWLIDWFIHSFLVCFGNALVETSPRKQHPSVSVFTNSTIPSLSDTRSWKTTTPLPLEVLLLFLLLALATPRVFFSWLYNPNIRLDTTTHSIIVIIITSIDYQFSILHVRKDYDHHVQLCNTTFLQQSARK